METFIRDISATDEPEISALLRKHWGSTIIVSRGKKLDAATLIGFIAVDKIGKIVGLVTLHPQDDECEIVTLNAFVKGAGIGASLIESAKKLASDRGIKRLWLITSNDNTDALRFYQKQFGMRMVAVHRDAINKARKIKPEIPLIAENGILIQDEIELEIPV